MPESSGIEGIDTLPPHPHPRLLLRGRPLVTNSQTQPGPGSAWGCGAQASADPLGWGVGELCPPRGRALAGISRRKPTTCFLTSRDQRDTTKPEMPAIPASPLRPPQRSGHTWPSGHLNGQHCSPPGMDSAAEAAPGNEAFLRPSLAWADRGSPCPLPPYPPPRSELPGGILPGTRLGAVIGPSTQTLSQGTAPPARLYNFRVDVSWTASCCEGRGPCPADGRGPAYLVVILHLHHVPLPVTHAPGHLRGHRRRGLTWEGGGGERTGQRPRRRMSARGSHPAPLPTTRPRVSARERLPATGRPSPSPGAGDGATSSEFPQK